MGIFLVAQECTVQCSQSIRIESGSFGYSPAECGQSKATEGIEASGKGSTPIHQIEAFPFILQSERR